MNMPVDRITITPQLVELFARYYEQNRAWGVLHVVLDDGNYEDGSVEHCIQWAWDGGDAMGYVLAVILRQMTRSQRCRLGRRAERLFHTSDLHVPLTA